MLPLQVMCIKLPDFAVCYIMNHLTNFKDTWMTCPKCYVSHGIILQVTTLKAVKVYKRLIDDM